jgi:hypothetical protein
MRAEDQFHTGIVVDDLEAALTELSGLFGYTWCDEVRVPTPVELPAGKAVVEMRFAYSMSTPRLEIIQSASGTLWEPASGSGIHHLGYWSDDVEADSNELERRGFTFEAAGRRPEAARHFAFYRGDAGPRIELVSRALQPAFEHYWSTGRMPT